MCSTNETGPMYSFLNQYTVEPHTWHVTSIPTCLAKLCCQQNRCAVDSRWHHLPFPWAVGSHARESAHVGRCKLTVHSTVPQRQLQVSIPMNFSPSWAERLESIVSLPRKTTQASAGTYPDQCILPSSWQTSVPARHRGDLQTGFAQEAFFQ